MTLLRLGRESKTASGGQTRALAAPLLVEWADGRREAVIRPCAPVGASEGEMVCFGGRGDWIVRRGRFVDNRGVVAHEGELSACRLHVGQVLWESGEDVE